MLVIGHRGAAGVCAENTLRSINEAISAGADWVEIDIRRLGDQIMVLHDERVDRTTSGTGLLKEYSFEDLRQLDAGDGERVPTLAEVIALINGRCGLNIEIKEWEVVDLLTEMLADLGRGTHPVPTELLVSAFDEDTLRHLAAVDRKHWELGVLSHESAGYAIDLAIELRARSVNVSKTQLSAEAVARAHRNGLDVFVYTVNERADFEVCESLSVDAVFTDYPARAIAFLCR